MPPGTCRLCNGRHAEVDCHQYCTPADRIQRVALLGRCAQCLDFKCSWLCSIARCSRCDEPHHEALCTQLSAIPFPTSNPMPSTSYVSAVANRPTFGDFFDATVPQRGARDQPNKRKTLLPPPEPRQKKPGRPEARSSTTKVNTATTEPAPASSKAVAPALRSSVPAASNSSDARDPSCVFCDNDAHSSAECTHYRTVSERKSRLVLKARCYRCWRKGHTAYFCRESPITCAKCGRADHHVAVCEDAVTNTVIPSKSTSGLTTATASKSTATEQRPASSSTRAALEVPAPTPSSAEGRAAKTGDVATAAAKDSRSSAKSSPSTTLNAPTPTPSAAHEQAAKPTDVKDTVSATTAVASLQVVSSTTNATSSAENRSLNESTASRRPVAASAAKPIEELLSKDDKTGNGARHQEGLPAEISVTDGPSCPVETGREALAAAETIDNGSVPLTSLPANLSPSVESSSSMADTVTTSDEAPTSVPAGNDHSVLPRPASDDRLTTDENNCKATDEKNREEAATAECQLSDVLGDLGSRPSLYPRAIRQEVPASVTQEVEVARKPGASNDAFDGIVDGSETSCTAAKAASPIDPKPALASFEDNHLSYHSSIAEAPMKPKNTVTDFADDHQETDQMPTTTSDTSDVASSRDGERECDPKDCTEPAEASTIIDDADEASEEAPTSPDKGATPRVAEPSPNCAPVCKQPVNVSALPLQRNDEEASQLAESAVPVQSEVDTGPSEDNDFAGCATTTTDSCNKMDDDQAVTVTPQGTDEEAPQLAELGVAVRAPGPSGHKEFATSATSAKDICAKVDDEAFTPIPQENDEVASQLAEPALLQAFAAAGPPDDNDFVVCATPTTGPCDKMDVDEPGTELSRLISELEVAVSGSAAAIFPDGPIYVDAIASSDASRDPPETVVKEEGHAQSSPEPSTSQNWPEADERTAWLSQIERILSPSKAESNVRASRTSASQSDNGVLSSVPVSLLTSPALRSAVADDDARMAQEYALQKLAEDLQQLQQDQQAFEAEKAQFEGRKRTFDEECEMLNAMKAAVDAEKEEARRLKQSARDRTMNLKSKEQRLMDKEKRITGTDDQLKSTERRLSALEKKLNDERRSIDAAKDSLASERADMEKERKSWHDKLRDYDERLKEEREKVEGYWRDVQEREARCQRQKREVEDEFALLRRKQRDFDEELRKQSSKYRSRSPHSSSRGSRERSSTDRYQPPSTSRHRSDELRQAEEEIRSLSHQLIAAKYDAEDAQKNLQRMKEQRDDEAHRREKAEYEAQTLRRQLEDCTQKLTDRTEALNKVISERSAAVKRAADEEKRWREQQQQQADVIEKQEMEIEVLRWSIEFRKQRSERKLEEAKTRKQQQQKNVAASGKPSLNLKTSAAKSAQRSVKREVCDDGYEPATSGKAQALGTGSNAAARSTTVHAPSGPGLASVISSRTRELLARFPHKTVEKYIAFIVTNFGYFKNIQASELTDFLKRTDPENAELSKAVSQIYSSIPSAQ
ncbi:hypothetical protein AAVH_23668 [Aphelenchoides avenae]|nr:hypothetical protein AAVH_23668 [Aphelenchus avenae]